jgi:hypothetical protein
MVGYLVAKYRLTDCFMNYNVYDLNKKRLGHMAHRKKEDHRKNLMQRSCGKIEIDVEDWLSDDPLTAEMSWDEEKRYTLTYIPPDK